MKFYLAIIKMIDWPIGFKLCSTREKARDVLYAELGGYIVDCLKEGVTDEAVKFIKELKIESDAEGNTKDYFCVKRDGGYDEYYIEEVELDA